MAKDKAVVLCSGGLNSAVVTALASVDHVPVLLHVRLGHRASDREHKMFEALADHFDVADRLVVDMPQFGGIGGIARFSRKGLIEDAMAIGDGPSNCHIPGLVGSLLSAAYAWAWSIGAGRVCIGVSEDLGPPAPRTSRLYPDYSREYLQLCSYQYAVASRGRTIELETPVIDLNRAEIIRLGRRFSIPFGLTWSCVVGGEEPCGRCVGCATRNRGFLDAMVPDPLMMQRGDSVGARRTPVGAKRAGPPAEPRHR